MSVQIYARTKCHQNNEEWHSFSEGAIEAEGFEDAGGDI